MAAAASAPTGPAPTTDERNDLADALTAVADRQTGRPAGGSAVPSTRRTLVHMALGSLLIAGVFAALNVGPDDGDRVAMLSRPAPEPSADSQADVVFDHARAGDCLTWANNAPDRPAFVECSTDHLFEVAESVDMRNYREPCELAVRRYLGTRYDPNGKFTVAVLWSGDGSATQSGGRHLLCGLELPGTGNRPIAVRGQVAQLDQSKVWPAGTCLGIDAATHQPTETSVDCSAPHAGEVTGTVNLSDRFPGAPPAEPDQDAFLKEACTRTTDAYLSPNSLQTPMTLIYDAVPRQSWIAGSRQVSCRIGAALGDRGWAALTGSAKARQLTDPQGPVAEPQVTERRPNPTDQRPSATPTPVGTPIPVSGQPQGPAVATPPGPAVAAPPSAVAAPPSAAQQAPPNPGPPPQVIEIPGIDPITLPAPPPGD
jgi:Septum formation